MTPQFGLVAPNLLEADEKYQPYIGRFAPSPTGPLHFGSLVAALASYLDAKSNLGKWCVRIEDLDPPREPQGAAEIVLDQLQALGFVWDGEILYQSSRLAAYDAALQQLNEIGLCFCCNCTRPRIQALGGVYDGHCRSNTDIANRSGEYAVRVRAIDHCIRFDDLIQGEYHQNIRFEVGDFVIKRKDNLFAYQLAVVVDDAFQNITDVVRGFDLIDSTTRQIYLQQQLSIHTPRYAHFPVAANFDGDKLSKQQHASAIDVSRAGECLLQAMKFLGLNAPPELTGEHPDVLMNWAISQWDIQNVPKLATISGNWI
ncbi:MAG: glutamyl-Q tRNA(Asp) synthetase [Pseudohongiellaceae bacterium]|jgi:glutamyl-Q tRNA(Asp) synthetase